MGLIVFHRICLAIQTECGKYIRIFLGILWVPYNIAMDLNNVIMMGDGENVSLF